MFSKTAVIFIILPSSNVMVKMTIFKSIMQKDVLNIFYPNPLTVDQLLTVDNC